jgi:hypothetical protein
MRGLFVILLMLASLNAGSTGSRPEYVREDFNFSASVGLVYLNYFTKVNGKEIYDCFSAVGNVEMDFKKLEKGNTLKIKYKIDRFGEAIFIKYIHNVRVRRWMGGAGIIYCVYDHNGNELLSLLPLDRYKGDKEYKYWICLEWIAEHDKP